MYLTTAEVIAASKRRPVIVGKEGNRNYGNNGPFSDLWQIPDICQQGAGEGAWKDAATPAVAPGETLSSSTSGAIPLPSPVSGRDRYVLRARARTNWDLAGLPGRLLLIDRLVQAGSLVANIGTVQTVNTAALPRFTDGEGVRIAIAQYAIGITMLPTTTFSASYTNEQGVSGRTSVPVAVGTNTGSTGDVNILPLDTGDYGVRSVQTITVANPPSAAGNVVVILFKPLCWLQVGVDINSVTRFGDWTKDWRFLAMPKIAPDACLSLFTDPYRSNGFNGGLMLDLLFGDA